MENKYEEMKNRYEKGVVTDIQLLKYKELGVITEDEYNEIYYLKKGKAK